VQMSHHQRGGVLERKYTFEYDVGLWTLGSVQVVKDRKSGDVKTCKTVPKTGFVQPRDTVNRLRRLQELRHPHICSVDDVLEDATRTYVISEKCAGGDLADWTVRVQEEGNWLQEQTIAEYMRQALIAVAHAHAHKVCHRDLRPSSLALTSKMPDAKVKVMDLGLASVLDPEDAAVQKAPSPYTAPEVLTGFGRVVPGASDVWSIGAIAHSLLVGHPPSQDEGAWSVGTGILSRRAESDGWSDRSPASRDFVRRLLLQAGDRPTAARALQHPWISGVVSLDFRHWNLTLQAARELQNRLLCYLLAVLLIPDCLQYREWFQLRQSFANRDTDRDGLLARHVALNLLKDLAPTGETVAAALDVVDVRGTEQLDLCAAACAAVVLREFAGEGQPMGPVELAPLMLTRFFQTYGEPPQRLAATAASVSAAMCNATARDTETQTGVSYEELLACLPEEGSIDSQALAAALTQSGGRGTPLAGNGMQGSSAADGSWGESLGIEGFGDLVKQVFQTCGLGHEKERQRAYRSYLGGR